MKYLLGVVILWALLASIWGEANRRSADAWEHRAVQGEATLTVERHRADVAASGEAAAEFQGSQSKREAQGLRIKLAQRKASVDSTVDTVLVNAPVGCESVVELFTKYRDLYAQQEQVVVALTEAGRQDSIALDKRAEEVQHLRLALDTVSAVLRDRPKPHRWLGLLPKPAIVVGYGVVVAGGRVEVGPALTVGIRIAF